MHLFVENLTNVDFSYLHSERGLVGETWLASIVLEGALDQQGMVCDFGVVKKTLRHWLDTHIDHCLVVPENSAQLASLELGENTHLEWHYRKQWRIQCTSPKQAITVVGANCITPSSVAEWCIGQLRLLLPDTIDKIQLSFAPEPISYEFYHYSHGLKKHQGNCQRIAHGHRSTIEIYCDDKRDPALEKAWAKQWQDIYIGTQADLASVKTIEGDDYNHFVYQADQGDFSLLLPAEQCYLIDTDSTVEFIAQHIANTLKQQQPGHSYKVRAFEGIGKGAIAFA